MLAGVVSSRGAGGSVNTGDRFRFAFSAPTVPVPVPAASSSDSSDVREQTHHPAAAQTRRAEEFRPMCTLPLPLLLSLKRLLTRVCVCFSYEDRSD